MLTNSLIKKVNKKQYVLQQLKGCVMAFSWYQLHPDNKLCMRIRRESDDAEIDVGFRDGYVDFDTCHRFLSGSITGFITTWYNQAKIAGATNAVQTQLSEQPRGIFYSNNINTMGVSFGGVSHHMSIQSYPEIDILAEPISLYFNFRKSANTSSKYLFCRNLAETTDRQYGVYIDNTPPNNISQFFLNGGSRCSTNLGMYFSKGIIRWQKSNVFQDSNVVKRSTQYLTWDTPLTSVPNVFIGCRGATGGTKSGFFDGQIRTIMLFNSALSESAVELMRNIEF